MFNFFHIFPGISSIQFSTAFYAENETNRWICSRCNKSYRNKGSLNRHVNVECGKEPQHICFICRKGFKQKANFQRHNATVHGELFSRCAYDQENEIANVPILQNKAATESNFLSERRDTSTRYDQNLTLNFQDISGQNARFDATQIKEVLTQKIGLRKLKTTSGIPIVIDIEDETDSDHEDEDGELIILTDEDDSL